HNYTLSLHDALPIYKIRKERREFFIPKASRESALYGSDFEIHLRNKLTQRAIARECAAWVRKKAKFKSNKLKAQMQQFICIESRSEEHTSELQSREK